MTEGPARILIVEDEEGVRRNLRLFLEDDGFDVITAASGEEGLLFVAQYTPDAAIVDLRLPGIDGEAFVEKAFELRSDIRIVIYTGSVSFNPSCRLRAAGIRTDQVFRKPLPDMSVLVDAVRKQLTIGVT
jgi:DNA-binding response OmpR family regulator